MIAYGLLFMAAMLTVYYLVYSGTYGVLPGNIASGAWETLYLYSESNLFDPALYGTEAFAIIENMGVGELRLFGKTLTMLMTVLYFSECLLALQIRRPNKSLWNSLLQDASKRNFIITGVLFGIFLSMMYIPGLQVALAGMGFNFMFIRLTILDWLICFVIAMIPIMGFEGIKWLARRRKIEF